MQAYCQSGRICGSLSLVASGGLPLRASGPLSGPSRTDCRVLQYQKQIPDTATSFPYAISSPYQHDLKLAGVIPSIIRADRSQFHGGIRSVSSTTAGSNLSPSFHGAQFAKPVCVGFSCALYGMYSITVRDLTLPTSRQSSIHRLTLDSTLPHECPGDHKSVCPGA